MPIASPSRTVETAIEDSQARLRGFAEALMGEAGKMSLADWYDKTATELKTLHIMSAMAGYGTEDLSSQQMKAVSERVREQSAYLWRLAGQVSRGEQPLNDAFLARVDMYSEAARGTFSETERGQARADGMQWERRILGPVGTEHCGDCLDAAGMGWQPIGTLPAIGESQCLSFCACGFEYSDSAEQPADDAEPDEETPPEEEEADVPEPSEEEQTPIEEQLTEPVGNQPPSDDEMADRIVAAATDYLESGPIREPRHQVSDAQAHKRHIAGIVNRIDEISLDAAQKVHAALGLEGDGTSKAHIRRALAAYLRNGYAG